jgi:hypothetical protein
VALLEPLHQPFLYFGFFCKKLNGANIIIISLFVGGENDLWLFLAIDFYEKAELSIKLFHFHEKEITDSK